RAAAATRRVIRNAARFSFQRRDPALVHGRGTRLRRVRAGRRTLSLRGRRSHCGCGQSLRRRLRRGASARTTRGERRALVLRDRRISAHCGRRADERDRKSTRLNSSHVEISYAVFCLKKKKKSHSNVHITLDRISNGDRGDAGLHAHLPEYHSAHCLLVRKLL